MIQQNFIGEISKEKIKAIILEIIYENPIAIKSILSNCDLEFTEKIKDIEIKFGDKPVISFNRDFLKSNCFTDEHIKALIFHEYLHLLFNQDFKQTKTKHEWFINNLSLDIIINAVIDRQFGEKYSSFMSELYSKADFPFCLLRKPEEKDKQSPVFKIWESIYKDKLVSRDLKNLLSDFFKENNQLKQQCNEGNSDSQKNGQSNKEDKTSQKDDKENKECGENNEQKDNEGEQENKEAQDKEKGEKEGETEKENSGGNGDSDLKDSKERDLEKELKKNLLGDHQNSQNKIPKEMKEKLKEILNLLVENSLKIPGVKARGIYDELNKLTISQAEKRKLQWKKKAYEIIRKLVIPDTGNIMENDIKDSYLPVLSTKDKRAFLKTLWSPFIPISNWDLTDKTKKGYANIYLDVSGSMEDELPLLIEVLSFLLPYIKNPFWAFSNKVVEAEIKNGKLITDTTSGTDLVCVLEHIIETCPACAVIFTDGYVGHFSKELAKKASLKTKVAAVITGDGTDYYIKDKGIKCFKLEEL